MQPSILVGNARPFSTNVKPVVTCGSFAFLFALLFALALSPAWGQSTATDAKAPADQTAVGSGTTTLPTINVTDVKSVPKTELSNDPAANPASVTVFDYPDEKKRSIRDYVDLLKPVTGVSANNFDQGGVGFGLTLRGFSQRSNGSNAAVFIDGVPVNQTSHTLSNGYADLTPLIPELIARFVLTRGPFDVRAGANALGGSLQIVTLDRPPSGVVLTGGSFNYGRAAGVYAFGSDAVTGYGSLLGSTTSGYRQNAELHQVNTFNKVIFPLANGTGSLRLQIFSDDYGAPGFINRAAVENGTLSARAAVNPTDGGTTEMQNIAFNYRQHGDQPITANAYVLHSNIDRFSSRFTTTPFNPDGPGQALQTDDRVVIGGTVEKYFRRDLQNGVGLDWFVGTGLRLDVVESGRFETRRRVPTPVSAGGPIQTEDTDYRLTNPFAYGQLNFKPASWAKLTAGLRYDQLYYKINDRTRARAASPKLGVSQPKAGIAVTPAKGLDFFVNFGRGFRTPSAIAGGTLSTPAELVADPNAPPAKIETREIGVLYSSADGVWRFMADLYRTSFTNELQGRPAPLPPLSLGPSRRNGYDVEARARVYQNGENKLSIFANYSRVKGELVGRTSPGTDIPDIADYLAKYGFDLAVPLPNGPAEVITFSASQVFEGPKSLEPTGAFKTKSFSRIDATLAYTNKNWKGFSAFVGFVIYPNRRLEETAFLFAPSVGVSPKAPVTAQGGVFIPF